MHSGTGYDSFQPSSTAAPLIGSRFVQQFLSITHSWFLCRVLQETLFFRDLLLFREGGTRGRGVSAKRDISMSRSWSSFNFFFNFLASIYTAPLFSLHFCIRWDKIIYLTWITRGVVAQSPELEAHDKYAWPPLSTSFPLSVSIYWPFPFVLLLVFLYSHGFNILHLFILLPLFSLHFCMKIIDPLVPPASPSQFLNTGSQLTYFMSLCTAMASRCFRDGS